MGEIDVMTTRDVMEALDISRRTVWLWVASGRLPSPIVSRPKSLWSRGEIAAVILRPPKQTQELRRQLKRERHKRKSPTGVPS